MQIDIDAAVRDVKAGTMWNEKGPLWDEYQRLWEKLVPDSGMCHTTKGEAVRSACKLMYDAYNNGGCNSTMDHFLFHIDFIEYWWDSVCEDGPDGDNPPHNQLMQMKKALELARKTEDNSFDDDMPCWSSDDGSYLLDLEMVTMWTIWKVSTMTPEED